MDRACASRLRAASSFIALAIKLLLIRRTSRPARACTSHSDMPRPCPQPRESVPVTDRGESSLGAQRAGLHEGARAETSLASIHVLARDDRPRAVVRTGRMVDA